MEKRGTDIGNTLVAMGCDMDPNLRAGLRDSQGRDSFYANQKTYHIQLCLLALLVPSCHPWRLLEIAFDWILRSSCSTIRLVLTFYGCADSEPLGTRVAGGGQSLNCNKR